MAMEMGMGTLMGVLMVEESEGDHKWKNVQGKDAKGWVGQCRHR